MRLLDAKQAAVEVANQSGEIGRLTIAKADGAWACSSLEISLRRPSNLNRPWQVKLHPSDALRASCMGGCFVSLATRA
jgi:hypothetical protein